MVYEQMLVNCKHLFAIVIHPFVTATCAVLTEQATKPKVQVNIA